MEGEKKTERGVKLQLNRQAGQASEAVEVGFTVRSQSRHAMALKKNLCNSCGCNL